MALSVTINCWFLTSTLIYILLFTCRLGKADKNLPETGAADASHEDFPQTGVAGGDPTYIVTKALLCFNEKNIYSSCNEAYRLCEKGNLDVPLEYTDEYCNGPCLTETYLVLNCIENILSHFVFYNKATIEDVRETIKAGCSYGPKRGDFNVAEHIKDEESNARKASNTVLFGLVLIVIGLSALL